MVFGMATVAQPTDLTEANFSVQGILREARGEQGSRKVVLDLIVEGFGNQADGHYYSAQLLERVAPRFQGAKMYSDHLTREAEQKLGGLPRSWRDMVGRIDRVWTDVNEAGKRVIRGEATIFDDGLWRLLEQAIDVVGVSINARGTAAPGQVEGRRARVVNDITQVKSVDVVAEAGAGGRVLALVEGAIESAIQEGAQMSVRDESIDAQLERDLLEDDKGEQPAGEQPEQQPEQPEQQPATPPPPAQPAPTASAEPPTTPQTGQSAQAPPGGEAMVPVSAVAAIAREAALAVVNESGRPGSPVGGVSRAPGSRPSWNDGTGYVEYAADELWQGGDPIDTRRPRPGQTAHIVMEGDNDDGVPGLPDDVDDDTHIPGLDDEAAIEAHIEARARELAGERLFEAVREGLAVVRDEYERRNTEQLAEAERKFEQKLAQRDQRTLAAGLIESARLPRASTQALKAEFHDAFFEEGESKLLEAVNEAIAAKQRELGQPTGARVTGGGDTAVLTEGQIGERRPLTKGPTRSGIDEGIERELG